MPFDGTGFPRPRRVPAPTGTAAKGMLIGLQLVGAFYVSLALLIAYGPWFGLLGIAGLGVARAAPQLLRLARMKPCS